MKVLRLILLIVASSLMLMAFSTTGSAQAPICQPGSTGFFPLSDLTRTLAAPDYNTATVTNKSTVCAYQIGLAAYRKFDENINNQELFSYQLAVINPGETLMLTVALPECKAQVDLFYGSLIQSFSGGVRYGNRLLAYRHVGTVYCQYPKGNEGCTPGYWKNHENSWPQTGYSPNQVITSVFAKSALYPTLSGKTMLQTLQGGGGPGATGGAQILLRAATAAVLNANANAVDYPRTAAQVIFATNNALNSQNRDTMLKLAATLDGLNNGAGGCPLN
jgi:hypothetical protein